MEAAQQQQQAMAHLQLLDLAMDSSLALMISQPGKITYISLFTYQFVDVSYRQKHTQPGMFFCWGF